jgi:hypothetical protein
MWQPAQEPVVALFAALSGEPLDRLDRRQDALDIPPGMVLAPLRQGLSHEDIRGFPEDKEHRAHSARAQAH